MHRNCFYSLLRYSTMASKAPSAPLVAVIGATGTGKSKLAISIASRFNGEIINGDAMQMYHGLPIVTNQIPENERNDISHHLLGCIGIDEEPWHVGRFSKECRKITQEIRGRGKLPVLVGGTHYYTQAVLFKQSVLEGRSLNENEDDDEEADSSQSEVELTETVGSEEESSDPILEASTEDMLQRLREVDPVMANRWHPKDRRKIRRSLEIWLKTGRKASEIYKDQKARKSMQGQGSLNSPNQVTPPPILLFWLHTPPEHLKPRLSVRVDKMLEEGLIKEVDSLYTHFKANTNSIDKTKGIWVSIGYKEFEPYLSAIESGGPVQTLHTLKEEAIERTKVSTRQYAKRQERWIRIKLGNALAEAGAENRLFVLDTSQTAEGDWNKNVTEPAERVVSAFLAGEDLEDPKSVSKLAREVLDSVGSVEGDDGEIVQVKKCDICEKVLQTEKQWQDHLKGRGHKMAIRAKDVRRKDSGVGRINEAKREERRRRRMEGKEGEVIRSTDS